VTAGLSSPGAPILSADIGESLDTLCLLFRVGLTHLVEHLALNTVGPLPYAWNGFVDLAMCGFYATGWSAKPGSCAPRPRGGSRLYAAHGGVGALGLLRPGAPGTRGGGAQRPGDPFQEYPNSSADRISYGKPYFPMLKTAPQSSGWRRWFAAPPPPPTWPHLLIGDDGVMLSLGTDRKVTVRRGACAGYLCGKEGERTAVGLDGFTVCIVGEEWVKGDQAIRDLDATFPKGSWIEA
jgi:hypothetical protein